MNENEGNSTPEGQETDLGADPIKQLKGEFNRKNDKLSSQLEAMARSQEMLLAQIQSMAPKASAAPKTDIAKDFYTDPEKTIAMIEERAERRVMEKLASQGRTSNVIQELTNEYPELADPNAEITKRAQQLLSTYTAEEQRDPRSFQVAVYRAAQESAVKPRSKRDPEEFMGPSHNPYGAPKRREASPQKILSDITPLAEAMGLDMSDKETQARMVERTKRNFKQQETPLRIRKSK